MVYPPGQIGDRLVGYELITNGNGKERGHEAYHFVSSGSSAVEDDK